MTTAHGEPRAAHTTVRPRRQRPQPRPDGAWSQFTSIKVRVSPAAIIRGGASPSAVARLPQGDVGGAVFGGVLELDQAAADPAWPEFGRPDLEVQVGLAARLRDLAPTGADLVALAGIDPIVG